MTAIDLNCDVGEIPDAIADGSQEALMPYITSVNIACGGHAGDDATMRRTVEQALRWKLAIGAHPGYADRANFGRLELDMTPEDITASVYAQIRALAEVTRTCNATISHVKAHGALYNQAARNRDVAAAIARAAARFNRHVVLTGLAGSLMLDVFRDAGFRVAAEAFADRRYEPGGTLRSRSFADSLVCDPDAAATQALSIVRTRRVVTSTGSELAISADTICIHGDTPGALQIAKAVAGALRGHGVDLKPVGR